MSRIPDKASYHYFSDCENLNSSYYQKREIIHPDGRREIEEEVRPNSGIYEFSLTKNAVELEEQIDKHLDEIEAHFQSDGELKSFSSDSGNVTQLSNMGIINDDQANRIHKFHKDYKEKLINMLKNWYILRNNPELDYDEMMLQHFGFQFCKKCAVRKFEQRPL
jgi:hypothetical protein